MNDRLYAIFNGARLRDRQIDELMGMAHGIIADGTVNKLEADYLYKWLVANQSVCENPLVGRLAQRIGIYLSDGVLDDEEAADLHNTLEQFAGGEFELGELLKATTLPVDEPAPPIVFEGKSFCFTGTFGYGSRKDCEAAVGERGGIAGSLKRSTDYLVIGVYATDSWAHSSYGRKIEKALENRSAGSKIAIVHEPSWVEAL